jgi:aminoglycoside 6'-N-acetyltransferase
MSAGRGILAPVDDRTTERPNREVRLRPIREDDLPWLAEMRTDPDLVGEHNWSGEPRVRSEVERELRERFAAGGFAAPDSGTLVVELDDGTCIGDVSWRTERWGPSVRSRCPSFGIALLPQHRGRGHGSIAQRLLLDHLFSRDPALHRVQSDTAADNLAEQRSLEKVGMVREGVVRDAEFRDGRFHDHVLFGILRSEWESGRDTSGR